MQNEQLSGFALIQLTVVFAKCSTNCISWILINSQTRSKLVWLGRTIRSSHLMILHHTPPWGGITTSALYAWKWKVGVVLVCRSRKVDWQWWKQEHEWIVAKVKEGHCSACSFAFHMCTCTHTLNTNWRKITPKRRSFKVVVWVRQLSARPTGHNDCGLSFCSLLQLVALATITLGAQPVRGDASEGESTSTGGCISDWREMSKAYLERQSSADVENSIFDIFYPSHAITAQWSNQCNFREGPPFTLPT